MVEQGRAEEEALLMALQREAAPVEHQFGAFVDAQLDIVLDLLLVRGGDHRAVLGVGIGRDADPQALDLGKQLLAQALGGFLADRHHHRQGHAALAGRAVGRADDVGDRLVEIGVGQDDAVVLGAAHGLDALAVRGAAPIDILRRYRTSRRS